MNMRRRKRKKNMMLSIHRGRTVLIATGAKLPDTKYKFYGFNDDVIEIIN